MAIQWGAWEYSGGNGIRLGIEVTWAAVSTSSSSAVATVEIWTQNQYSINDTQTLSYGGVISGSDSFSNNDGDTPQLRATKTYTHNYSSSSYGSSPGTRSFSASLSGAYNGVTPSVSTSSAIPARPYAPPTVPSSLGLSRISDTSTKLTWVNNATAQKPYSYIHVQKRLNGGSWTTISITVAGSATSWTDNGCSPNQKIEYQIRAINPAGESGWWLGSPIYTTPATPPSSSRSASGSDQVISWSNSGMGYSEYYSEVLGFKNDVYVGVLGTVGSGVASFTHTPSNPVMAYSSADRWKYQVRHKTSSGPTLYSGATAYTTETSGVTSAPSAPTGLSPDAVTVDPTASSVWSWSHNPTDSSAQTQFQIRRRLQGAGTWVTDLAVTSSSSSWTLPADTYSNGQVVEWQVATRGSDATWSPWSATATVTFLVKKLIPLSLNLGSGEEEADYSGWDWKTLNSLLVNSWVSFDDTYGPPRYCRRGGIVYLQGMVKSGTAQTIATLPVGYRPSMRLMFVVPGSDRNTGAASAGTAHTHYIAETTVRLDVLVNGDLLLGATYPNGWVSLSGLCFPADQ